jgi:hypothetical protein
MSPTKSSSPENPARLIGGNHVSVGRRMPATKTRIFRSIALCTGRDSWACRLVGGSQSPHGSRTADLTPSVNYVLQVLQGPAGVMRPDDCAQTGVIGSRATPSDTSETCGLLQRPFSTGRCRRANGHQVREVACIRIVDPPTVLLRSATQAGFSRAIQGPETTGRRREWCLNCR